MAVAAPEWLDVRVSGSGLRACGRIPEDLLHFEGHFPGQPLLPGVAHLQWVLELARDRLALAKAPSALEALKFREPLRPGQDFELHAEVTRGLRYELVRAGRVVSTGRVRFDGEPEQHVPEPLSSSPPGDWPLRLPHAGPMRWIERILDHGAGATLCEARIRDASPLCVDGFAPAWLSLELLAQGMAAQGGSVSGDDRGLRGLLVGARRVELRTRGFEAGESLWVRVQHLRGEIGFVVCECALGSGKLPASAADAREVALAFGTLTAFVESAKD